MTFITDEMVEKAAATFSRMHLRDEDEKKRYEQRVREVLEAAEGDLTQAVLKAVEENDFDLKLPLSELDDPEKLIKAIKISTEVAPANGRSTFCIRLVPEGS
jgi:hypothetical protein